MPSVYPATKTAAATAFNMSTQFSYQTPATLDFQYDAGSGSYGLAPGSSDHYGPGSYGAARQRAQAWAASRSLAAQKAANPGPDYFDLDPSQWREMPGSPYTPAQKRAWREMMKKAGWKIGSKLLPFSGWALSLYEFYTAVNDWLNSEMPSESFFDEALDAGWIRNDFHPNGSKPSCGRGRDFTKSIAYCTVGGPIHSGANTMPASMGRGIYESLGKNHWYIGWAKFKDIYTLGGDWFFRHYADDFYTKPKSTSSTTLPTRIPGWRPITDTWPGTNAKPVHGGQHKPRPTWKSAPARDAFQDWERKTHNGQTTRGNEAPSAVTSTSTTTGPPGGGTSPTTTGTEPPPTEPPGTRTRERKIKIFSGPVKRFFDQVTEACDFVDSAYKALPCAIRAKYRNRSCKMKAITVFNHWTEVDPKNFILNLVYNQIEDILVSLPSRFEQKKILSQTNESYGKIGSSMRKLNKLLRDSGVEMDDPFGEWFQTQQESFDAMVRNYFKIKELNGCWKK